MKAFVYLIIVIVAAAVVTAFFVVGSPGEERERKFDGKRIQDLQFIQNEIINYWQAKTNLPESLTSLNSETRGVAIPRDPETEAEYGYEKSGELNFKLCANFTLPSPAPGSPAAPPMARFEKPGDFYSGPEQWLHQTGYVCFDRTIDKDFYKNPTPVPARPID